MLVALHKLRRHLVPPHRGAGANAISRLWRGMKSKALWVIPAVVCFLGGQVHADDPACSLNDHRGEQLLTARFHALE